MHNEDVIQFLVIFFVDIVQVTWSTRGLFRTQQNICNEVFLQKKVAI